MNLDRTVVSHYMTVVLIEGLINIVKLVRTAAEIMAKEYGFERVVEKFSNPLYSLA